MRRIRYSVALSAFVFVMSSVIVGQGSVWASTSGVISISSLLSNPSTYDGSHVVVTGSVTNVKPKTSHAGNAYETFDLCDSSANCVEVFTFGQPALSEGDKITIRGTFTAVKHVGQYTFYNEIQADDGSL
jgi:exonuclease VII large subunit